MACVFFVYINFSLLRKKQEGGESAFAGIVQKRGNERIARNGVKNVRVCKRPVPIRGKRANDFDGLCAAFVGAME